MQSLRVGPEHRLDARVVRRRPGGQRDAAVPHSRLKAGPPASLYAGAAVAVAVTPGFDAFGGQPVPEGRFPLRIVRASSSALPFAVVASLEALSGVSVIEERGMSEGAHQIASDPRPPGRRQPGTVGPAAGPEIAIRDADGRAVARDLDGEVRTPDSTVTPCDLVAFAAARLAPYTRPRQILIVPGRPRGPNGKVQCVGLWVALQRRPQ